MPEITGHAIVPIDTPLVTSYIYVTSPIPLLDTETGAISGDIRTITDFNDLEVQVYKEENGTETAVGTAVVSSVTGEWNYSGTSTVGTFIFRLYNTSTTAYVGLEYNNGLGRKYYLEDIVAQGYRKRRTHGQTFLDESLIDHLGNYTLDYNFNQYTDIIRLVRVSDGAIIGTEPLTCPGGYPKSFEHTDTELTYVGDVAFQMICLVDRGKYAECISLWEELKRSINSEGAIAITRDANTDWPDYESFNRRWRLLDQALIILAVCHHNLKTTGTTIEYTEIEAMYDACVLLKTGDYYVEGKGWLQPSYNSGNNIIAELIGNFVFAIALDKYLQTGSAPASVETNRDNLVSALDTDYSTFNDTGLLFFGYDTSTSEWDSNQILGIVQIWGLIYANYFDTLNESEIKTAFEGAFLDSNNLAILTNGGNFAYDMTLMYRYYLSITGNSTNVDDINTLFENSPLNRGTYKTEADVYYVKEEVNARVNLWYILYHFQTSAFKPGA